MSTSEVKALFPVPVTGKRKRAQVSYLEADIELDDDNEPRGVDDTEPISQELELDDSDTEYGKKKAKKPARRVKKARFSNKKTTSKKKAKKPFPFLSLPAELRDYIYDLAFVDPNGLRLVTKTKNYHRVIRRGEVDNSSNRRVWYGHRGYLDPNLKSEPRNPRPRPSYLDDNGVTLDSPDTLIPSLLAVNKQIHAEASSVLYMQPIIVEDTMALHTFLATIGPNNMKLLQDITVKGWGGSRGAHKTMNLCSFVLLSGAINLKMLYFDCTIGYYRNEPRLLARQIYRDGNKFLVEYGAANGKKDAAVDVIEMSESNYDINKYYAYRQGAAEFTKDEFKCTFKDELRKLLGVSPPKVESETSNDKGRVM